MNEWWKEALDHWSKALLFTYDVAPMDGRRRRIPVGEWFHSQGTWCVQLDGSNVARVHARPCEESMRRALSWTLKTSYSMYSAEIGHGLCDLLLDFGAAANGELLRMLHNRSEIRPLPPMMTREPGYLIWIRFDHLPNQAFFLSEGLDELVDQVIEAFAPEAWHIWFTYNRTKDSILLYQCETSVKQFMEEHDIEEVAEDENHLDSESSEIRLYAQSLAAILELDAMVGPSILVSQKIVSSKDIRSALVTLVLVNRTQSQSSTAERIAIFAEQWLQNWLQVFPDELKSVLQGWITHPSEGEDICLAKEMVDVLEGIVAANLNVSEAARMLYLHRNTLVNRIERIKRSTGFDVRNFFDAAILWILLKMK